MIVNMENIGKACYAIIDSGVFGLRIVSGIITGIRYTTDLPLYCIQMGKDLWWSDKIVFRPEDLLPHFGLADLNRVKESHGLMIKYKL